MEIQRRILITRDNLLKCSRNPNRNDEFNNYSLETVMITNGSIHGKGFYNMRY